MNWRALWARLVAWYVAHSERERYILGGVGGVVLLVVVYGGVLVPISNYRSDVRDEIDEKQELVERYARSIAATDSLRAEHADLKGKLTQAKTRLLPGDSGTLGAAALQDRVNTLANEKGVTVQSTQVMREEEKAPFRRIAVRLTLSSELKPFAELLAGLENGPQQLTVPFLELNRRGAVTNAKGPRTLSATLEVAGYLLPHDEKPKEGEAAEAARGEGVAGADEAAEAEGGEVAAPELIPSPPGLPGVLPSPVLGEPTPPLGAAPTPGPPVAAAPPAAAIPPAAAPAPAAGIPPPATVPPEALPLPRAPAAPAGEPNEVLRLPSRARPQPAPAPSDAPPVPPAQ